VTVVSEEKAPEETKTPEAVVEAPVAEMAPASEVHVDPEAVKAQLGLASGEFEALRTELLAANKRKEEVFLKKQTVGQQIAEKIKLVNEFKQRRNDLTKQVRELKVKRDSFNEIINAKIDDIKKLTDGKPNPFARPPPRMGGRGSDREDNDPASIKRKIEALEYKLETQPMSFDAEQKINKQIRDLKKQYDEKMKAFAGMEEVMTKSHEIDTLKREANELHAQVTHLAADSQKHHEQLIDYSKEIDELKKEEETLYQTFLEHKKVFAEINAKLKMKQGVIDDARDVQREEKAKARRKKQDEETKTLKERAKEVEEKVKKKQKLTTEDLLALQGSMK